MKNIENENVVANKNKCFQRFSFEKAGITKSLGVFEQDKRVKVIDRPFTPTSSTNKPLILFVISGFIAGIFLGCGTAIIQELIDSSIRTREQLQTLTGVAVLSRIPYINSNHDNHFMDHDFSDLSNSDSITNLPNRNLQGDAL